LDGIWTSPLSSEVAKHLPRTLENTDAEEIQSEAVAHLPKSFREIELLQEASDDHSWLISNTTFPSGLRYLTVYELPQAFAEKLPPQLTRLYIRNLHITPDLVATGFPPNLTHLASSETHFSSNLDLLQLFKTLPRNLKNLSLMPIGGTEDTSDPAAFAPSDSSSYLPRFLETLKIGFLSFSGVNGSSMAEWVSGLPKTLVALHLSVESVKRGCFSTFGSLVALNRFELTVFSPIIEGGWPAILDFSSLPRKLQSIQIMQSGCEDSGLTDEMFKGAPRLLQWLIFPNSPKLSSGCRTHLKNLDGFWFSPDFNEPSWFRKPPTEDTTDS
jgi:hypothetical protein